MLVCELLPVHMKELVNQLIAEAIDEGFETTRKLSGPQHVANSTRLEPVVCEHEAKWAATRQVCRYPGCGMLTDVYCAACAKDQPCGPAAGYYCHRKSKDCLGMHHRKRARTCTVSPEMV